jgi:hypothetical protein
MGDTVWWSILTMENLAQSLFMFFSNGIHHVRIGIPYKIEDRIGVGPHVCFMVFHHGIG